MANGTLQNYLRESRGRLSADRVVFAEVMSRLSEIRSKKDERDRKPVKDQQKGA